MSFKRKIVCPPETAEGLDGKYRLDVVMRAELERLMSAPLSDESALCNAAIWQLFGEAEETGVVFLLDENRRVIKTDVLCTNGIRLRESYVDYLRNEITRSGARYFFAAHNHVNGTLEPSPHDLVLTDAMTELAEEMPDGGVTFLGHYITDGFRIRKISI